MAEKNEAGFLPEPPSFEEALSQLDAIVQELEEGEVPLTQGLARYEAGIKLLKQCYQLLEHAQRRIELLNRVDPEGRVQSEPFDDEAMSLEQKTQSRGRRRSRKADSEVPPAENEIDGPGRLF